MPTIKRRKPGELPEAREWNALADAYNAGAFGFGAFDDRRPALSTSIVKIKNTSGSDRAWGDVMQLGQPTQTIGNNREEDLIFAATTAAADETPVVLLEPIANNQFGRGCIFGMCFAKIAQAGSTSEIYLTPNGTNHNFSTGTDVTPIKLLALPSTSAASVRPVLIGVGASERSSIIVQATSGIAARSGTTLGSATCTEFQVVSNVLTTNTETVVVKNLSLLAIPTNAYVLAHREAITGEWIAQAIIAGLRYQSPNLQYTIDGTTWVTYATANTECPTP